MCVLEKNRQMETVQLNGLCLEFRAVAMEEKEKRKPHCKGPKDIRESDGETRKTRTDRAVHSLHRDHLGINKNNMNVSHVIEK